MRSPSARPMLPRRTSKRPLDKVAGLEQVPNFTPPFPFTLFVVDSEDVEETYVWTASVMRSMTVPVLEYSGMLGCSWRPLWAPACPRLRLSELREARVRSSCQGSSLLIQRRIRDDRHACSARSVSRES